ncbi:MAG: helix-turn-helix domain-containing protein [Leptospiraceae bacterium]|nr:helix-turn-helix domain-containing protein [Leptospiraceae bacterium]
MGDYTQNYSKFMNDIIDSGTWAKLSSSSKTLYPVLLKFSDQNFKQVWPSTSTLLKLTGFKSKKSIQEAKRDLIHNGLLKVINGKGHENSVYIFTFNYKDSKISPQRATNIPLREEVASPRENGNILPQSASSITPNQINITITNNNEPKNNKIVKEKESDFTWSDFLNWASVSVTSKTLETLKKINFNQDGEVVFLDGEISAQNKALIRSYFQKNSPSKIIVFDESTEEVRI